jgi:hypothetical protein
LLITGLFRYFFRGALPPNFADIYLAGVFVLAYRYSWKAAAVLAGVCLSLGAYLLAPLDASDHFQLVSFTACCAVILFVTAALRRRRSQSVRSTTP